MNKYGKENFWVEVLEENIPIELLDEKEIYGAYGCDINVDNERRGFLVL